MLGPNNGDDIIIILAIVQNEEFSFDSKSGLLSSYTYCFYRTIALQQFLALEHPVRDTVFVYTVVDYKRKDCFMELHKYSHLIDPNTAR